MSAILIKVACHWVHLPEGDGKRGFDVNIAKARKLTWAPNPVRATLHYSRTEKETFTGVQAIAIIDAVAELTGGEKLESE